MYYYILDLGNKNIFKMKEKMEMIMASFGISGDFGKISPLASAYELARRAKDSNYTTVVAIGGSEIINQAASALVNSDTALGVIPVEADPSICDLIGACSLRDALEVLRTRKIETIDLGKVKDSKYFLTESRIENPHPIPTVLDFGSFKIGGNFKKLSIANGRHSKESFRDGVFEVTIDQKKNQSSFWNMFKKTASCSSLFHQECLKIETEEQTNVLVDNEVVAKTPCEIKILPLALRLIVARQR